MGLFGKSFDEKVGEALEKLRGKFPKAKIAAQVDGELVTLTGQAPDMDTKKAIMISFNGLVETENTLNKITIPQPVEQPKAAGADLAEIAAAAPAAKLHKVVSGDTLSAIAKKYYGSANQYMKIFEANRDILNDPNLIKVGQKLRIPE